MEINKNKYIVNDNCYYQTETQKNKIILCDTGRKSDYGIIHLMNKHNGIHKEYPHFTISRNGTIYQHYETKYYSNIFDDMQLNKSSIIVMLENMGGLYVADNNKYYNKLNEECDENNVMYCDWRNFLHFEKYTKQQHTSVSELCLDLCEKHKIVKDTLGNNAYDEDAKFYNGIICRSNIYHKFLDLNPSFNFKILIKKLS